MNAKQIQLAITRVLFKHECAVIPGFGAFILRKNYGVSNPFSGQLKPASHSIFFNSDITEDDGFVAHELRETFGFSFKQSSELIKEFILAIQNDTLLNTDVRFGDLGNFHRNPKGELFFLADASLNLSKETFGLPVVNWYWKSEVHPATSSTLVSPTAQKAISSVDPQQSDFEHIISSVSKESNKTQSIDVDDSSENQTIDVAHNSDITASKRKQPLLWRAAASFAIISIGAGVLITAAQIWSVTSGNDLATLVPKDTQHKQITVVPKPLQTEINSVDEPQTQTISPIIHALNFGIGNNGIQAQYDTLQITKGKYIVSGGSYITVDLAKRECLLWQKLNIDACVVSVKRSSLCKVVLGRFSSEQIASSFAESIKNMPTGTLSVSDVALDWK